MRTRFVELVGALRQPGQFTRRDWIAEWWTDLPLRQRWWWHQVLFEDGAGWLRWAAGWRSVGGYYEPPEDFVIWPPLRRMVMAIRYRERWPLTEMVDPERRRLWS